LDEPDVSEKAADGAELANVGFGIDVTEAVV
jgi:hypothetical protein